jgi:tetratricopeptide (TPR) repeat protein
MGNFIDIFKITLIAICLITISTGAKSQEYKEIHKSFKNIHIADSLYNIGEYKKALNFYKKSSKSLYSKTIALTKISDCYFDLGNLTKSAKYKRKIPKEESVETIIHEELRMELLRRKETDQMYRKAALISLWKVQKDSLVRLQEQIDKDNQRFLDSIIGIYGWPDNSLVGKDGAIAAWLIAQHADTDPEFQEKCLKLMKRAFSKNEIDKQNYAYLVDRVMLKKYGFQLFGSQVFEPIKGTFQERPLFDKQIIETLRKYFDMKISLNAYLQFMQNRYYPK